jgi:hypothetical protein
MEAKASVTPSSEQYQRKSLILKTKLTVEATVCCCPTPPNGQDAVRCRRTWRPGTFDRHTSTAPAAVGRGKEMGRLRTKVTRKLVRNLLHRLHVRTPPSYSLALVVWQCMTPRYIHDISTVVVLHRWALTSDQHILTFRAPIHLSRRKTITNISPLSQDLLSTSPIHASTSF